MSLLHRPAAMEPAILPRLHLLWSSLSRWHVDRDEIEYQSGFSYRNGKLPVGHLTLGTLLANLLNQVGCRNDRAPAAGQKLRKNDRLCLDGRGNCHSGAPGHSSPDCCCTCLQPNAKYVPWLHGSSATSLTKDEARPPKQPGMPTEGAATRRPVRPLPGRA
jgi:hypothetical protein